MAKRCVLEQNYYWQPIGSRIWEIDWYQNEWPWPLFRGRIKVTSANVLHSTLNISETYWQRLGSKGPPIKNGIWGIKWSRDRWRHVHVTLKSSPGPNNLRAQLKNRWRCYLATIANYHLVCCKAVRLAILATAWLLVLRSCEMWAQYWEYRCSCRLHKLQWSPWSASSCNQASVYVETPTTQFKCQKKQ